MGQARNRDWPENIAVISAFFCVSNNIEKILLHAKKIQNGIDKTKSREQKFAHGFYTKNSFSTKLYLVC